jgi:acetylornithine deacetylase/succinyl-diaminopimelate desuccinylase-like protein
MTQKSSIDNLTELIQASNSNFIEKDLRQFLQIPSFTSNKQGCIEAKEYIISYISNLASEIKEIDGIINPLIIAKIEGKLERPLLIYMMYDTQPITKEKLWLSNPFGAQKRILSYPLDKLGDCIIARGAYNSKTPLMCFLNILKFLKEKDELPISLLLVIDGEEELGSPTLLSSLETRSNLFNSCLDAYYPSAKQDLSGKAVLKLGYKGILSLSITASTNNIETHSAYSPVVPNPASDLISLLNLIYSERKFSIESLSKSYQITSEEKEIIEQLMKSIDFEGLKNKAGIVDTVETDPQKIMTEYLFSPSYNISTLKSGYIKGGVKNMVANLAECNIDIRFAHNVQIDQIFSEIENIIKKFANTNKSSIKIKKNIGYERSKVPQNSHIVNALKFSFDSLNVMTEIWPISAAAAPLSKIQKELGLNFITGGLGIGGYAHAPNEFIQVKSIINTRLCNYYFLKKYAELIGTE